MEKKWIIGVVVVVLILLLGYILTLSSKNISETATENYIENAIESQGGGKADVDLDNNNYSIETEEGSFTTGEAVTLPDNFPSDVFVHEGKLLSVMTTNDASVYILIETEVPVAEVKKTYLEKLTADGWEQSGTMDFGDTASILGKKGERELSVMINKNEEGVTNIALTLVEGQ